MTPTKTVTGATSVSPGSVETKIPMKPYLLLTLVILSFVPLANGQAKDITNSTIIEMVKSGLSDEIILSSIQRSEAKFDVSADALLVLKNSGVSNAVISKMIEKQDSQKVSFSESSTESVPAEAATPRQLLSQAKTIALVKSSAQPSRQALEKELLKRKDWKDLNLSIHRYKDDADLYVEIGYVSMSWITHRYVYRIYDRRTGTVLAAGETTSWGSLAGNLAKHISQSLTTLAKS